MLITFITITTFFLNTCFAVPPSPIEKLWEEINNAKNMMENIGVQLDKFNSLYLMKLEQRMMTLSNTLGHIDSNIKNLQERAHVWDTFQLHVSAWNEQIGTLDKKVEIISKGQEKLLILDEKINSIQNIEYKIERIFKKLEDTVVSLQSMNKLIENNSRDPLLGEFTLRGVLSTLKVVERKLDKLQLQYSSSQSLLTKQIADAKKKPEAEDQKAKLLIKCNTPPVVEELLNDVSSKVDVLFDKFTGNEEQNDEQYDTSVDGSQETRSDPDLGLIKGLLKRLNQPCKRTVKALENLESTIKVIDNTTFTILEDGQNMHSDLRAQYENQEAKIQKIAVRTEDLLVRLDDMFTFMNNRHVGDQEFINTLFRDQEEYLNRVLNIDTGEPRETGETGETGETSEAETKTTEKQSDEIVIDKPAPEDDTDDLNYFPKSLAVPSNKTGCDELDLEMPSGIYVFHNADVGNLTERNLNVRYCDMSSGGGWTVIQKRGVNPDGQNFSLSWRKYKRGFGDLNRDFWFGNDFTNVLTREPVVLRVELENFEGLTAWAEYNIFSVGPESENYVLKIGGYRGNASDSFSSHNGSGFSTYDRKNDAAPECCPCAASYGSGWWFNSCFEANLNGVYYKVPNTNEYYRGIIWENWLGNYSLRKTKMMIRSRKTPDFAESPVTEAEQVSEVTPDMNYHTEEIPEDP